jgi:hypothetical protein
MHPTHVPSPHHPSSTNTKKDDVSSPPPLPLDQPSLDAEKVNAASSSPTKHNHDYELRDFFDGDFSCIEDYEMDLDAKDVGFECVEKPQDKVNPIHGDDIFSTNNKRIKTSKHNENVPNDTSLTQNNVSLIHGNDVISTNNQEINIPSINEDVPGNSSLPLEDAFVDSNKVKQTSSSPITGEDDNEFHSFLDGVFSSMQTYQMEFDVEDVSFMKNVVKKMLISLLIHILCVASY